MPTWGGILKELQETTEGGKRAPDFDGVRRKYLVALHQHTGRNVILYATKWTSPELAVAPGIVSIVDEDMEGVMETVHGLGGDQLDLIIHSPGGSPEAVEALVIYLRSKFRHIRAVVPHAAMSAATMLCCSADRLLLGKHSFLGPIDPQFILNTPLGFQAVPAQAILDQFDRAREDCRDPANLPAWMPMLGQFGPGLLVQCENAMKLSKEMVQRWLEQYMFSGKDDAAARAQVVADWLSAHGTFYSHGRHIPRKELEDKGFEVEHLEADQQLQDLVLSVFHATMHTFSGTAGVKIVENQMGKAWVKMVNLVQATPPPAQGKPAIIGK
jgi:hypothetical protein